MTKYINTDECWIPVPIELADNYKVWESSHYPENFFKFYPVTDKKIYTDLTYRLLSRKIGNRVSGFIATLIRIAILQTGIFSDPEHECVITMGQARRITKGLPDTWTTPDSSNELFVRITKCIHDNAPALIQAAIRVQLNRGYNNYIQYTTLLDKLSIQYEIEVGHLISGVLHGILMLTIEGLIFLLALMEDYEHLSTYDDIVDSLKAKPSDYVNFQPYAPISCKTEIVSERKKFRKFERSLYNEMRRYDRKLERYLKRRRKFGAPHMQDVQRPVLPVIFMYVDYVKFKYKGQIVYL